MSPAGAAPAGGNLGSALAMHCQPASCRLGYHVPQISDGFAEVLCRDSGQARSCAPEGGARSSGCHLNRTLSLAVTDRLLLSI